MLWGNTSGLATAASSDAFSGAFESDAVSVGGNTTVGILEAQAGVEWTHQLTALRGTFFVHGAFEYQNWTSSNSLAGVATATTSNAVTTTVTSTTPTARTDFLGLVMSVGFTY